MNPSKLFVLVALGNFLALNSFAQTNWTKTGAPIAVWTSIAASADGTKLVAISDRVMFYHSSTTPAGIYISTNSGTTWTVPTNVSSPWGAAISADGSIMGATAFGGGLSSVWLSTNFGVTWKSVFSSSQDLGNVASSADGHALLIGDDISSGSGFVFVSTNFGSSWSQISLPSGSAGSYVASSADGVKMFAAGYGSTTPNLLCISTNAGVTWKKNLFAPNTNWSAIACSADGNKIVASVNRGLIYTSTNLGLSWITNNNVPSTNWNYVASSADGTRLVAVFGNSSSGGGIYTTTNSGSTWNLNTLTNEYWYAAALSADGNKWFAAAQVASFAGEIYAAKTLPQPAMNIAPTNGNLTVSWIVPSTNFVLQSSVDLSSWMDLTNQPVLNLTNLQDEVYLSPTNSNLFYRLKTP